MGEYGYLNHSSTDRRDEEAIWAMFAALPCERIAIEQRWSPGEKKRPVFDALLARLLPGDTLYVHSLDRLGLDVREAVRVWKTVTREKGASIVVLNDPGLSGEGRKLAPARLRRATQRAFDEAERERDAGLRPYAEFELVKGQRPPE